MAYHKPCEAWEGRCAERVGCMQLRFLQLLAVMDRHIVFNIFEGGGTKHTAKQLKCLIYFLFAHMSSRTRGLWLSLDRLYRWRAWVDGVETNGYILISWALAFLSLSSRGCRRLSLSHSLSLSLYTHSPSVSSSAPFQRAAVRFHHSHIQPQSLPWPCRVLHPGCIVARVRAEGNRRLVDPETRKLASFKVFEVILAVCLDP